MDASPEPTPSTGSKRSEVDRTVQAPTGAVGIVQSPTSNEQIAPAAQNAIGPTAVSEVLVPASPLMPRVINAPDIDQTQGPVEDGPRPHPWEPAPEDPTGTSNKPSIGGAEQSSGSTAGSGK